ncbi:hypothetical protein PRZ48_006597 [Zasmidium cellare]|uniref:Uncharacterized protein n=1 Tax=Zasmidium cellare TaxID=395010 RepID=A0ABR0ENK1_ZASCE|nr:hypothetical protein PRZ48_006597 [Zasmidium cellare]
MISSISLALLGLSITANALPQVLDLSKACTHSFNSEQDAYTAWIESGAGIVLKSQDSMPETRPNWVVNMDAFIRGDDDTGMTNMDCGSIDGNCQPLLDCKKYKEKNLGSHYYVMRAIQGAHSLANYMREGLQDSAIESSLSIGSLIEYWKPEDSADKTMFSYLSAAFSMASGATAADPRVSGFMGFMSGVTAAASQALDSDGEDYRGSMEDVVLRMFSSSRDAIKNTLHAAMVADNADEVKKYLPEGSLAGFFGEGRYLFNDVSAVGQPVIDGMFKRMKQALVNVILRQTDHRVLVDDYIRDAGDCTYPGAWWSDSTSTCYYLIEKVGTSHHMCLSGDADSCDWKPLTDDQKQNIESYGVDLGDLYKNACQCAYQSQNSQTSPDPKAIPTDGSLPQCFYSITCRVGTPWDFSWDHSEVIEWYEIDEKRVPYS